MGRAANEGLGSSVNVAKLRFFQIADTDGRIISLGANGRKATIRHRERSVEQHPQEVHYQHQRSDIVHDGGNGLIFSGNAEDQCTGEMS